MFDAATTIEATLRSALGQSHRELEIVVVDDGSRDAGAKIVEAIAAQDPRLRLLRQDNAGVAAARNAALAASSGEFVAYLDADDLWAPDKLALQLAALRAAPDAALAYAWFRRIDGQDRILPPSPHPFVEGRVLHRHLAWNFIANGSALLVRGNVARRISFDPDLRSGCEDYLHQLRIALDHPFACVPQFLVGYRRSPGSLSASRRTMELAHLAMFDRIGPLLPASARPVLARRRAEMHARLARDALRRARFGESARRCAAALRADPVEALRNTGAAGLTRLAAGTGRLAPGPAFAEADPTVADGPWVTRQAAGYLRRLQHYDDHMPS